MAKRPLDKYDPRYVRQVMHTSYDRYVDGTDKFPRLRFAPEATTEAFPRKTQPIAATLLREWGIIHQDENYFVTATLSLVEIAKTHADESEPWRGLSLVRIGRNAVNMAMVASVPEQEPEVQILDCRRDEFLEQFGGVVINLSSTEGLRIAEDMLAANPTIAPVGLVVRDSNVSALFVATQYAEAS